MGRVLYLSDAVNDEHFTSVQYGSWIIVWGSTSAQSLIIRVSNKWIWATHCDNFESTGGQGLLIDLGEPDISS